MVPLRLSCSRDMRKMDYEELQQGLGGDEEERRLNDSLNKALQCKLPSFHEIPFPSHALQIPPFLGSPRCQCSSAAQGTGPKVDRRVNPGQGSSKPWPASNPRPFVKASPVV